MAPEGIPPGIEFIPMIYRYGGNPKLVADAAVAAKKAGTTALFDENGGLTRLGECYRDA